jgi:hypothetical protein
MSRICGRIKACPQPGSIDIKKAPQRGAFFVLNYLTIKVLKKVSKIVKLL